MKKVSRRAMAVLALTFALLLGMGAFVVRYFLRGADWAVFPGNPHTYSSGILNSGILTDRSGTVVLDATEGRKYAEDAALRKAMLHLLGDREGYIAAPMLQEYADQLVGYNFLTGTYHLTDKASTGTLTISASAQQKALEALGGRAGTVGVYNYKTGEILCAVSSPTYDPDQVPDIAGDTTGAYNGVYVNRFFNATFVPGSIFKLVTTAAALETLPDAASLSFQCDGSFDVEGDTVNCNGVHGAVDLKGALAHSCNVAYGQLALQLGPEVLTAYAEKLGVADSFFVDGYHTAKGNFDLSDAPNVDVAWSGIGQYTDMINPCGFLRIMGVIGGGGEAAEPYLMASVDSTSLLGDYHAKTETTGRLLDATTCQTLTDMMRNNVQQIYGQGNFGDLPVCAKSGTAEVDSDRMPHATFAGFVADPNCPLAFIVVVENAGSGSAVCASIAGAVLQECAAVLAAE